MLKVSIAFLIIGLTILGVSLSDQIGLTFEIGRIFFLISLGFSFLTFLESCRKNLLSGSVQN
jgi:hypothetical protein